MATPAAPIAAAPAPAAPTPAPAPSPTPTPAASASPAPEVVQQPTDAGAGGGAAPESGAPAETVAPAAAGSQAPKQEDFADNAEGLEEFLNARNKFREEHPDAAAEASALADAGAQPEDVAAPKADAAQQQAPADAGAPTPQALDEWTSKDPAFKAALEANPALKGELFAMSRLNERAKPIMDIVATPEEAQFAVENANAFVDLRTGLMLSVENPDRLPQTFDKLQDMFRIKDAAGNYVKDASGNVQMAEDYALLSGQFVGERFQSTTTPLKAQVEQLRAKIASAAYPSADAKAADEALLQENEYAVAALDYAQQILSKQESGPQLPELPPDATPAQKQLQEELKRQLDELNKGKQSTSRERRAADRATFTTKLNTAWGSGVGKMLDEAIAQEQSMGGVIPDFVLNDRYVDPQTGQQTSIRSFGMKIMTDFNHKVNSLPGARQKLAELQMLPPGPEAEAAANAYYTDLRQKYLPGIIRSHIDRVQKGILDFQSKRNQQRAEQGQVAGIEPRSGAAPTPQSMAPAQINAQARENAMKLPGYTDMSGPDQLEAELEQRYKLRGLGAR